MSSPTSRRMPIGPANASMPPPGYNAKRAPPLAMSDTSLTKPNVGEAVEWLKVTKPTFVVDKSSKWSVRADLKFWTEQAVNRSGSSPEKVRRASRGSRRGDVALEVVRHFSF